MIFGMTTFTFVHVVLSLVGIASGFVVVFGLLAAKRLDGWTVVFLISTVATSVTGFLFPFRQFLPSHAVGILSLLVLAVAILARYTFHLARGWRRTYVVTAVISLYLNVFVLVVQVFQKTPALKAIAPTQSEPPFLLTQVVVFGAFRSAWHYRGEPIPQRESPFSVIGASGHAWSEGRPERPAGTSSNRGCKGNGHNIDRQGRPGDRRVGSRRWNEN